MSFCASSNSTLVFSLFLHDLYLLSIFLLLALFSLHSLSTPCQPHTSSCSPSPNFSFSSSSYFLFSDSSFHLSFTLSDCRLPSLILSTAAACHSQDRPTAAVTPMQSATPVTYHAHLAIGLPPPPSSSGRTGGAMGCAASSLTPPNVSAASLDTDGLRPSSGSSGGSAALAGRLEKDVKVGEKNIMFSLSSVTSCVCNYPPLLFPADVCMFLHRR